MFYSSTSTYTLCSFRQIQKVVFALGDHLHVKCHACIGGTNVVNDINTLENGTHILVGTPGRVIDMVQRGYLSKL